MNEESLLEQSALTSLPTSFRVIGIGEATKEVIETVKSYRYDCVSATVLTEPFECIPTDEDKMVIIVAKDNEDHANSIANTFHEAGVLTIGLLDNADLECYDSVVSEASCAEYPDIIKAILQPIVTQGMIAYDFNDLQTTLTDAKHFLLKSVTRCGNERVAESIGFIKSTLTSSLLNKIERLSIFLYFNKEDKQPLVMQEMTGLTDFVSELPESIYVIWAVYPDESIKDEEIKVTILAAGKELENG
ncbi:cell division protein FtsZ [Prevotella sp. CAG:279]|nr:cell division protein FtsZ [Prevotella sp. CAG:279]